MSILNDWGHLRTCHQLELKKEREPTCFNSKGERCLVKIVGFAYEDDPNAVIVPNFVEKKYNFSFLFNVESPNMVSFRYYFFSKNCTGLSVFRKIFGCSSKHITFARNVKTGFFSIVRSKISEFTHVFFMVLFSHHLLIA